MKLGIFLGITTLMIWACSPVKEVSKTAAVIEQNSLDSTEYEILIMDLRFDQWYLINFSTAKDRSNEYYRNKNNIAAAKWNEYYNSGQYYEVIESYLDYWPNIDYGIEVNRKLYWYFKFVKEEYKIQLF